MFAHKNRKLTEEMESIGFKPQQLGAARYPSPMEDEQFVEEGERVLYLTAPTAVGRAFGEGRQPASFEVAGPRRQLFFDPATVRAGIVTCGGLCPGVNDVIRAVVLSLYHHYGVSTVYGFRYGYAGLVPENGHEPILLTPDSVSHIGDFGGTWLGSSRGPQDVGRMVSTLEELGVQMLFAVGGDGTLRGVHAICAEIDRRGLPIAVIGIPKTIDNDISFVEQSFGFITAASEARRNIYAAHSEALGAYNGIGLVKLMGRHSGFIAAYAALADSQVNFCLVPESPFTLDGFLPALRDRLERRQHAVIAVAEGAGQDLMPDVGARDASGNVRLGDIGLFLRDAIDSYLRDVGLSFSLKYIDPSYTIRSLPANAFDSAFCLLLGYNAVHAAMAGRTNTVIGVWNNQFTHLPVALAVSERKTIDPHGRLWNNVALATGQPRDLT